MTIMYYERAYDHDCGTKYVCRDFHANKSRMGAWGMMGLAMAYCVLLDTIFAHNLTVSESFLLTKVET
jgi:hypothetical protein